MAAIWQQRVWTGAPADVTGPNRPPHQSVAAAVQSLSLLLVCGVLATQKWRDCCGESAVQKTESRHSPVAMSRLAVALLVVAVLAADPILASGAGQCEDIRIPMCRGPDVDLGYNRTRLPNRFQHESQDEAGLEVHQFWPLIEVGCSAELQTFLCLLYVPECRDDTAASIPPCRELCDAARAGCLPLMTQYGFRWPARMDCSGFPSGESGAACAGLGGDSSLPEEPLTSGGAQAVSPGVEVLPPSVPRPAEQCCPCTGEWTPTTPPQQDALRQGLESLVRATERMQNMQEETLKMQQTNLRLERQKLDMEIQLIQSRLGRN